MPLVNSKSKAAVGENIKTEMKSGKPQKQAVAIALSVQRRAKGYEEGGRVYPNPAAGGIVGQALENRRARMDAIESGGSNALAAPPEPRPAEPAKPPEKSWLDRAKAAVGMKNGGKVKCAAGGKVTGPGTSRSDSIPARLSAGEYVLPADTAKKVGYGNLDALKAKTHTTPMQRKMMTRK